MHSITENMSRESRRTRESHELRGRELIAEELRDAKDSLEEVEEERMMTLGGTGVHIPVGRVESMRAQFEKESAELAARIRDLETELAALG